MALSYEDFYTGDGTDSLYPINIRTIPIQADHGLLVAYNPTSQKATDHALNIATGSDWPAKGPVIITPTEPTINANREMIEEYFKLWPKLHLAILGGDGTINNVLNASLTLNHKFTCALSADGNASDLAKSVNYGYYKRDPIASLTSGTKDFIRPIDVSIRDSNDQIIANRSAFAYTGLGISGAVANIVSSQDYRRKAAKNKFIKYIQEIGLTLDTIKQTASFEVEDNINPIRQLVDTSLLNGGRMAKTHFANYLDLFQDKANYSEIADNKYRTVAKQIGQIALGKSRVLKRGEVIDLAVRHPKGSVLFAQIDGETIALPDIAKISFKLSDQRIAVARTR